jgi:hypothetical protein
VASKNNHGNNDGNGYPRFGWRPEGTRSLGYNSGIGSARRRSMAPVLRRGLAQRAWIGYSLGILISFSRRSTE